MYKLIIIDDEEKIAQLFPWQNIGFEVVQVFTGARKALQYIAENPVDVVLTDIEMPDMNGLELSQRLMEYPNIQKIFFSSYSNYEYFRTALFIGDSLSQGFALYAPTRDVATVCAYKSTSPNQVLQNFVGQRPDGSRIEMWDDIKVQSPSNIYVLYGTNALISQSDEAFLKYYSDLLDKLRERFAGVPIYVQSITPTTAEQGVKQPPLENGHIRLINNAIAKLAVSKGLYYLDAQEALADADGNLRGDYVGTYDGIHMNPTGYAAWADYILTHTVYSDYNKQFVTEGPYA